VVVDGVGVGIGDGFSAKLGSRQERRRTHLSGKAVADAVAVNDHEMNRLDAS
jgi:hypothetical protein